MHLAAHHHHSLVHVVALGILGQEVPPDPAFNEGSEAREIGGTFHLCQGVVILLHGACRERPLTHLHVRGRWQINPAARRLFRKVLGKGRGLEPFAALLQKREEPIKPALFVHRVVCLGPDAKLFTVISHDHETVALR